MVGLCWRNISDAVEAKVTSIKTIPPETATEQRNNATRAVGFAGANSPKLAKTMESQKISKIKKGMGTLCPLRCSNDHRAWIRVLDRVRQSVRRYFCRSSFGFSSRTA